MENFVLIGKAKAVFQIIELMARGEKAVKTPKTGGKVIRNGPINKSRFTRHNAPYWN